jgi:cytochrome c oxidase subunit 2
MVSRFRGLRRLLVGAPFLIATLLLASGCFGSKNPQDVLSPRGAVAADDKSLFYVSFWIAVVVFVITEGALLLAVMKFRHRRGSPDVLPKQVHGNTRIEIAWTIAPALILAALTVPTIATIYHLRPSQQGNPLNVTVIGHQWWWEFQYPDQKVTTANELHIPTHRRVNLLLKTNDVTHIFYVPVLAGGMDSVANHDNEIWIEADHEGTYQGQCTQFCGASHAFMRFKVMAESQSDFDTWAQHQNAQPITPAGGPGTPTPGFDGTQSTYVYNGLQGTAAAGYKDFQALYPKGACIACHAVQGVSAGKVGPNLTHFGERTSLAGATLSNTPDNVAKWLKDPPGIKPNSDMPNLNLTDQQIADLVSYLESLK